MEAYGKGHLQMEEYMAFSLEPIAGRTLEEVEHLIEPWVEDVIEPIIFGDACRCIAEHRKRGDRILIISASGTHRWDRSRRVWAWTNTWPSSWKR